MYTVAKIVKHVLHTILSYIKS